MEGRTQRQNLGHDRDDGRVGGEEPGDFVAEQGEEEHVQAANGRGGDEADFGGCLGRSSQPSTDEVGDARRSSDAQGERDLEGEGRQGGEDGLGGEHGGAEVGGGEGKDFEGQDFGFDHEQAGKREPDHRCPVVESAAGEAWPAVAAAAEEEDVEEEGEREEIVGYGDGDGGANEAEVEVLRERR